MKKIKQKAFFIKAALLHLLLLTIISVMSLVLWENSFYDTFMALSPSTVTGSDNIVLVTIDTKSIKKYRWPWKRELYGDIIKYFNNYTNVKAIAFDSVLNTLDEQNPESDKNFFNVVKHSPKLISGYMIRVSEYDDEIDGISYNKKFINKYGIKINDKRKIKYRDNYYNSLGTYPDSYFNSLQKAGSVNVNRESDNVVRNANELIAYDGTFLPTLALRTYLFINNTNDITLTDKYILVDKTGLKIPTESVYGSVRSIIKFHSFIPNTEYSHRQFSAIDIINSEKAIREGKKPLIDPSEFDGKIVYIGANVKAEAMGLADEFQTPVSLSQPGVDIQATALDNLMNNNFMTKASNAQNIAVILLLSLISFIIIRSFSFIVSLVMLLVLAFAYYFGSFALFSYSNFALWVITPLAAQLSTMVFGYSYRFILEGRNKEKIKQAMGKYLSQDIMKNVVQNIDDIRLGGKKANVTVLFADIRGFTSMSERMTAEEVSVILNEYFSEIEPIITKYNGVINKFIGDAVMAIFGEPIQDINHPANAVKCANEMLKKVEWLQGKWINEGKPKIEIGIGINTGEAFVGNIGSEKRLEYTVIGDMVNLASRIESYNKVYKTNFLISSSTYSQVSGLTDVIKISEVTIRGKSKKMDIYEVLRITQSNEVR